MDIYDTATNSWSILPPLNFGEYWQSEYWQRLVLDPRPRSQNAIFNVLVPEPHEPPSACCTCYVRVLGWACTLGMHANHYMLNCPRCMAQAGASLLAQVQGHALDLPVGTTNHRVKPTSMSIVLLDAAKWWRSTPMQCNTNSPTAHTCNTK